MTSLPAVTSAANSFKIACASALDTRMKNYLNIFSAVFFLLISGLGCGFIAGDETAAPAPNSNRTLTDKAVDTTVGKSQIGIPECDQVMDSIEAELNNAEDNFALKAAKAVVLNRFRDSIRESFEQNPNDKESLGKTCREIKVQFDSYKAKEQSGSAN